MTQKRLLAVFAGPTEANACRDALIAAGFSEDEVVVSINMTDDGIAAEVPGQAFENQSTRASSAAGSMFGLTTEDAADAKRMADVQRGGCVLTISIASAADRERAELPLRATKPIALREP